MGSSQAKDKHIDLYMELAKPIFVAGEYVEGAIYLDARRTRPYHNLIIRLTGREYVYW